MGKLKTFTGLDKVSWETLEKYKGSKNFNLVQISRDYPEKISRTYCRCGCAVGSHQDVCPECGKTGHIYMDINGTGKVLKTDVFLEKGTMVNSLGLIEDAVVGFSQEYVVNIVSTKASFKEFEIRIKPKEKDFVLCSDKADLYKARGEYKLTEVLDAYPYEKEGFDYYHSKNLTYFAEYINNKSEFPVLIENIKKYKNVVNHIITREKTGPSLYKTVTSMEEVFKLLNIPKKSLYPYINNLYTDRYYSYWGRLSVEDNVFEDYNDLPNRLQSVAEYILIHGDTNISSFKEICNRLKSIDEEYADILMNYVRSNYVIRGNGVIKKFVEDVEFLKRKGLEVCSTNLDTRNLNLIKNKEYITETKKYNEKRTLAFLDMFDLNPLESLQYLDTRRAPSKALKAEISAKLD